MLTQDPDQVIAPSAMTDEQVYAGLYAVLPEAIAWRALPAQGMISIASRRTLKSLLEIEFGVAILRRWQFIPCQC